MNRPAFPIDELAVSVARADAVLALLAVQFDDPDAEQQPAMVNGEAIGAVRAELASIRALVVECLEVTP